MSEKVIYFGLFGASIVIGFLLGRALGKFTHSTVKLWRILTLAGAIILAVGLFLAGGDHRFRILADIGFCLQTAGFTLSFKN
jgi:hypothetical protein